MTNASVDAVAAVNAPALTGHYDAKVGELARAAKELAPTKKRRS